MVANVSYTPEEWEEFNPGKPYQPWVESTYQLTDMISEECYKRIYDLEVAQPELLAIVKCAKDVSKFSMVEGGRVHKEELGLILVCSDLLSIVVMYYMFGKLKALN